MFMADSLGTRIRRARERKRWTQQQLADALDVGLRTVGSWERDETEPRSSVGALEDVLGVSLTGDGEADDFYADPGDPDEMAIWWEWRKRYNAEQRKELIDKLRSVKRARGRDTGTRRNGTANSSA